LQQETKKKNAMYRVVEGTSKDFGQIEIRVCVDRAGRRYHHAFIDGYALSQRLEHVLESEFHTYVRDGARIPQALLDNYSILAIEPDYADPNREEFVTSDYWYTVSKVFETVDLF